MVCYPGASKVWLTYLPTHSVVILCFVTPLLLWEWARKGTGGPLRIVGQANSVSCRTLPFALAANGAQQGQDSAELNKFQQAWHWLLLTAWEVRQKVREQVSLCFCLLGRCSSSQECFYRGCIPLLCAPHVAGRDKGVVLPCSHRTQNHWGTCGINESIRLVNNESPAICQLVTRSWLGSLKRQKCSWSPSFLEWLLMTFIQVMTFSLVLGDLEGKTLKQKPWWPFEKLISSFPCSK